MAQTCSNGNVVHYSQHRFTNRECGIKKARRPRLDSFNEQECFPYSSIRFCRSHIPAKLIIFMDFFSDAKVIKINKINTTLRFGDGINPHFRFPYETNVTNKVLYQHSKLLMYKQRYYKTNLL